MLIWPNMLPTENKWHHYSNFLDLWDTSNDVFLCSCIPFILLKGLMEVCIHCTGSRRTNSSQSWWSCFRRNYSTPGSSTAATGSQIRFHCCSSVEVTSSSSGICSLKTICTKKNVIHVYVLFISVFAVVHGWKSISCNHNLNHTYWIHCKYRILAT